MDFQLELSGHFGVDRSIRDSDNYTSADEDPLRSQEQERSLETKELLDPAVTDLFAAPRSKYGSLISAK